MIYIVKYKDKTTVLNLGAASELFEARCQEFKLTKDLYEDAFNYKGTIPTSVTKKFDKEEAHFLEYLNRFHNHAFKEINL